MGILASKEPKSSILTPILGIRRQGGMHHIDKKTIARWSRDSSGQETSQDLDVMEVRMRAIIQTKVP